MSEIHGYSSIYNLGHKAIEDLFVHPVIVEEKIDGSQISFGKINGEMCARSKGATLNMIAPDGMFAQGCATINSLKDMVNDGWIYRGEYLRTPHHNTLTYGRIPKDHIIIFDIDGTGGQEYLSPAAKRAEAYRLGLECVPVLYSGIVDNPNILRSLLETESMLGGQKIEGMVIKPANYDLFGRDKKVLMGKFVSEEFKEIHSKTWKDEHATKGPGEIVQILTDALATPARWNKAVMHLREQGKIEDNPRDIGLLIPEIQADVLKECRELIAEKLFAWAWPQLKRNITHGMPEWYKQRLLEKQFEGEKSC